ncbi:MAG: ubiquinol-cytochrome c reductase iron-sulfur subunit [Myxococcales bacterium]|nr:ubiquinol-cytochrome c reductase iron-sulfur subunit [Myxococcales bacterium]
MEATQSPGSAPSRRRFLTALWVALGGVAFTELVWIAISFLRPSLRRSSRIEIGAIVSAGPVERFAPGSVTAFRDGKFYLVRLEDGGFLALHRKCTHLGCTVPWIAEEGRFACPCHASAFDLRGDVLNPPAPRALDLFPVRIENGIVKVDVTAPIRRLAFDPSQVVRA